MAVVTTQPVYRKGGWEQEVPLDDNVNRFALKISTTGERRQSDISVYVADSKGLLKRDDGTESVVSKDYSIDSVYVTDSFTRRVPGPLRVAFLTERPSGPIAPTRVADVVVESTVTNLIPEGVDPNWMSLSDATLEDRAMGSSVARLKINGDEFCSGFALSPKLLITNYHCLRQAISGNADVCKNVDIKFNYLDESKPEDSIPAKCVGLRVASEPLDYAILNVLPTQEKKVVPMPLGKVPDTPSNNIFVLHYPDGDIAKLSSCPGTLRKVDLNVPPEAQLNAIRQNCLHTTSGFFPIKPEYVRDAVHYSCHTIGGSSGSPVIVDGKVVALHFSYDYRYFLADAQLPADGDARDCLSRLQLGNWGRRICTILEDAKQTIHDASLPSCNP